jgi:hypothetical protein
MAREALSGMAIFSKSETRSHNFTLFGHQDLQKCIGRKTIN